MTPPSAGSPVIAVVIPAFRAASTFGSVLSAIPSSVTHVIVVDDGRPDDHVHDVYHDTLPPSMAL
jgi:hypothetical protein